MLRSTIEIVSTAEYALLVAMREVQFGNLYGVEIKDQRPIVTQQLSQAEKDLIGYIRAGAQYIDILTVHNGQPTLAETDIKLNGFRCRKRVKFPTVSTEG